MNRLACWLVFLTVTCNCGCGQNTAGPTAHSQGMAEMDFHGMKVRAEGADPGVWVFGHTEGVSVAIAGKRIVVEKERISVDGVTKAQIPAGTKSVRALSRNDDVVVEVDGREVFKLAR